VIAYEYVAVASRVNNVTTWANYSGSHAFLIKNTDNVSRSYTLTATCSGTASGCNSSASDTLAAGQTDTVTVSFNVGNDGGSGTVKLRAVQNGDTTRRDSATVNVTAVGAPKPLVSVEDVNPGATLDRSQCLAVALAPSQAWECGDVRIVHPLPSIRTLGSQRTPVLVYNSAASDPIRQIVAAYVTRPSTPSTAPDSVYAKITVNGTKLDSTVWAGSQWTTAGQKRRIALAANTSSDTTGIYEYTLDVATRYGDSLYHTQVTGEYAVGRSRAEPLRQWLVAGGT
jgi:hypothetical protein